jgi:hypothetical protein
LNVMIGTPRVLQVVQHSRTADADVLTEEQDAVAMFEVLEPDRADRRADALGQRHRRALVAHVGTVRQVVGAVHANEQLVEERCFERGTARGVEHRRLGRELLQLMADFLVRLFPAHFAIGVGRGVPAHRCGQSAAIFEVEIRPGLERTQCVFEKELGRPALRRQFPGSGLGAVLAELGCVR